VISGDNITIWYGFSAADRVYDPADPGRIFSWLMSYSHDDKGNVMVLEYKPEDSSNVDTGAVSERHRNDSGRTAARYLTRILYRNAVPYYPADGVTSHRSGTSSWPWTTATVTASGPRARTRFRPTAAASRSAPTCCANGR